MHIDAHTYTCMHTDTNILVHTHIHAHAYFVSGLKKTVLFVFLCTDRVHITTAENILLYYAFVITHRAAGYAADETLVPSEAEELFHLYHAKSV